MTAHGLVDNSSCIFFVLLIFLYRIRFAVIELITGCWHFWLQLIAATYQDARVRNVF